MGLMYGTKQTHTHKLGFGFGSGSGVSARWVIFFCIASFCLGVIFINRFGISLVPIKTDDASSPLEKQKESLHHVINCEKKDDASVEAGDIFSQVSRTHDVIMNLDKTISSLETKLASARSAKKPEPGASSERRKFFFVMGIMTAFSSQKRRDSIRQTWMPQGKDLLRLEKEKGIIIRFVIGHSATQGGNLDHAIDVEDEEHKDFLRLNHIEGYHELSSKTQIYFSTVAAKWDADFYIKVDDDVHINLGMIGSTLLRHRSKPRVYIGCMKSGPVLAQKGLKYHEPEYWKFGEDGNKYFRHATGQIYAISKDLATFISINRTSSSCAAFLANVDTKNDKNVYFNGNTYHLPAWSVSILADCKNLVFNTAKINSMATIKRFVATSVRDELSDSKAISSEWSYVSEPVGISSSYAFNRPGLVEQINTTADQSDYL